MFRMRNQCFYRMHGGEASLFESAMVLIMGFVFVCRRQATIQIITISRRQSKQLFLTVMRAERVPSHVNSKLRGERLLVTMRMKMMDGGKYRP
jgi:hypothetical protein